MVQWVNAEEAVIRGQAVNKLLDQSPLLLDEVLQAHYSYGYLLASWDSIGMLEDTLLVNITPGPLVRWVNLHTDSIDNLLLQGAGLRRIDFEGKVYDHNKVLSTMDDLLRYAEENGFPFATVKLDKLHFEDSLLEANLLLDLGRQLVFDSIVIQGDALLSQNYLQQYTGLDAGTRYKESLVTDLDKRLNELPFVRRTQPSVVKFSGASALPVVYLDARNANRFDFILGFLPNNEITGRLIVTGQGMLVLQNAFGQGEKIDIRFSKLESSTKSLQLSGAYPYLPSVPLGIEGAFDLFLKDSTFLERKARPGLLYQLNGNNRLRVFASFYNSDVLSVYTALLVVSKQLPANADMQVRTYGMEVALEDLDYRYNPRKGWSLQTGASAGRKLIRKNAAITGLSDPLQPEFDYNTLYDSIQLSTLAFEYQYDAQLFLPIGRSATTLIRLRGAANLNTELFSNELYRIGGNTILRGFDELSLFVSEYHIATLEWRYLLTQNGYAALFFDQAYTVNRALDNALYDAPLGFGASLAFETKAGIFGLSYALGTQRGNPVLVRNAKIHFGYVNYF